MKAGLEKEKAALLVAIGVRTDGKKVILALKSGYRESTQAWSELLRDLRDRKLAPPKLVIGDRHLGIWAALGNVFPQAQGQCCWNHRILNLLAKVPKQRHTDARKLLTAIPHADSAHEAGQAKDAFQRWSAHQADDDAAERIDADWERTTAVYRFPREHWRYLRTTNVVESPFAALRLRTDPARRFKKVANATAVIWKMLMVSERRFRRLNSHELLPAV